jgi:1,2-phenylacetyl-CoA epoxidase catalytic subunit
MTYEFELPKRHHDALLAWQKRNFGELELLQKNWDAYFPDTPRYRLVAKVEMLPENTIQTGMFKGRPRIERAADMKGNMLYSAVRIIKAQCSTELGSIQQHLETLDNELSAPTKFSILRICAEELRHAYQMFWVLSQDASWAHAGVHDVANTTMDELLAMRTGTHVLDAFNIPFHDPLDNMVFSFLIDRVGKYQLSMQKIFSYAPMAQSMAPMLHEESFHLRTGYELVREMALLAAADKGRWSLREIQKRINAWFPRAVEMFGNPDGGEANVRFGFKDRLNGESLRAYITEVARLLRRINIAVVEVLNPALNREELERRVDEEDGPLSLPDANFFRMRGTAEVAYQPVDIRGKRISHAEYLEHLRNVLPESLQRTEFFSQYQSACAPVIN